LLRRLVENQAQEDASPLTMDERGAKLRGA